MIQCFALLWFAGQTDQVSFGQMALPRFIMGMGLPLFFLPLNQIIMSGLPASELANAAGLSNFVRTFSGSIATAVTVFFWTNRSEHHYATMTEHITPGLAGLDRLPGAAQYAGHPRRRGVCGHRAGDQHAGR